MTELQTDMSTPDSRASTTNSSAISKEMKGQEKHNHKPSALARFCRKLSPRKARPAERDDGPIESPISSSISSSSSNEGQMWRVFHYFDENGDGKISPAELQSCVRTVGGELSEEEAETAVEASDLDGDGMLGFEEFQKLMEPTSASSNEKNNELKDAFGMYEMEGSGCITPTSLKRMLARLGDSRSIDDCKAMIRAFDLNGDGVLSFNEFTAMMR